MSRARLFAIVLAACASLALLAWGGTACVRYESARVAWSDESARVGSDAYDPAASDALYVEVERAREDAERAGRGAAVALGALLLIAPFPPTRRSQRARLAIGALCLVCAVVALRAGSLAIAALLPAPLAAAGVALAIGARRGPETVRRA